MTYLKAARIQAMVCGLLFSAFSFVYLYVFQSYVLEALHYSLAHGKTLYAPAASACIITLVLLLIAYGVNAVLKLAGELKALAYFPSCLILGMLTDVGRGVYMAEYHTQWGWLFPLLLMLFVLLAWGVSRVFHAVEERIPDFFSILNWNIFIVLALCGMTIGIGNSNRAFHHELEAEFYLRKQDYQRVLNVGERSLQATQTLTALRNYALSQTQEMGERLFQYPQYYGSDGLFFPNDSLAELRFTNDSVSSLIGVNMYAGGDQKQFLRNICYSGEGTYWAAGYYLSALLLDKDLDGFVTALSDLYDEGQYTLPRYYREAVLLYRDKHADYQQWAVKDSVMMQRFAGYQQRKIELKEQKRDKTWLRKEYGDTYWWYFDYQE